jgi:hypothetical protein
MVNLSYAEVPLRTGLGLLTLHEFQDSFDQDKGHSSEAVALNLLKNKSIDRLSF